MSVVYCYWEGDNKHWYYDLCWQTIKRHNPGAVLLGPGDVARDLGPVPDELRDVYVVHRVDWLRKAWVHKFGGCWVDHDFVAWADLSWLANVGLDFVGFQEWHGTGWMDNFFGARAGSPILKTAADCALNAVRQQGRDVRWLSTNADAMNHAMEVHKWGLWCRLPTHIVAPVGVMSPEWFTGDLAEGESVAGFQSLGCMTSMHGLRGWLDNCGSADAFLKGRSRAAALIRRGLGL